MTQSDNQGALEFDDQEFLIGSGKMRQSNDSAFNPTKYSIENMGQNRAFKSFLLQNPNSDPLKTLGEFKARYAAYRSEWQRRASLLEGDFNEASHEPLCLDIEVASVCDLACSFCFRDMFFTPDKIIDFEFAKKLIAEAAELGVPSIKLNWRGEPLLHPQIKNLISFAKDSGILEVMINTNATTLSKEKSIELIEAGLDVIIFSFDGGTKETYENMRIGRFKQNLFSTVYNNIVNFAAERNRLNSAFPRSKIQMVLTNETRGEQDAFFQLFKDVVDEVTVTQYNERGGSLDDLEESDRILITEYLKNESLPLTTPYMKAADGKIYISRSRAICAQPFQRMLITYDGRVGMCCHDWGAQHAVGYANEAAFAESNQAISIVENRAKANKKGYKTFKNAKRPKEFNEIPQRVESLGDIWSGDSLRLARTSQIEPNADKLKICKNCSYKDAYNWELIYEPQ